MKAEIITIGDEILIGQITDTNSQWIATELNKIGVSVHQISSIQDEKEHIVIALEEAEQRADIIILTGGLGPTKDDITKHTLAEYVDSEMEIHEETVAFIKMMFKKMNYPFTEVNRQQALVPKKCAVLKNKLGTAPGMWFDKNGKVIVSLPGVPNEMKGLMLTEVLPRIQKQFQLPYIIHKTILTYGMGESMVAARIEQWEDDLPQFIKLAYLPSYGRLRLRLSASGSDKGQLENELAKQIDGLTAIIEDIIVGYDESESIEVMLGKIMTEKKITLSIAESCTGGAIAKLITGIPGSSNYFIGSIVAYNKEVKEEFLDVPTSVIEENSVVSKEVAEVMAIGAQNKFNTDYTIATTGNAGPTKDDTDKSVGIVYIAIATPNGVFSEEFFFGKPRIKVIDRASIKSLEMLRKEILKNS